MSYTMAPIGKQISASVIMLGLAITVPLWIVPVVIWKLYRYSYIEICGWDDF